MLMLDAVKTLLESISALQITALVNKFMLPFAMAGRVPTDIEIEAERVRLVDADENPLHMAVFAAMCHEMRGDALLLAHLPGRA